MTDISSGNFSDEWVRPLLELGRTDPAPEVRLAALMAASHFPLGLMAWRDLAEAGCQIVGSVTGSPAEMKEMMDLVTSGKVTPVPIIKRKLDEADTTLQELRKGLIMGRAVLVP